MNQPASFRPVFAALLAATASPALATNTTAPPIPDLTPLHSFVMRLTDTTPQGSTSRNITYVGPDKLRVEIPDMSMVVVAIGRNVWLRQPTGAWQKADYAPGVDPLSEVRDTLNISQELKGPAVRFVGTAQIAGLPTKEYQVAPPQKPGLATRTTRIWIGATDGYPHKIEVRSGAYVFTAIYSQWNQPLTVSAP